MSDWWPRDMFDSEDNYSKTEGNDETAVVHVSADTRVINQVMECRIVQTWRYQPVTPMPGPRTPTATPVPRATIAPSGDFARVWERTSQQHYALVKEVLGFATGPEKVVWMSQALILWHGQFIPAPLKHNDWIIRRLDNDQVYLQRILLPGGWFVWEAALGVPRQAEEKNFLGTIQHFRITLPCADGRARCIQSGMMIWRPLGATNYVDVLYGDGLWEPIPSSLGWIAFECPGVGDSIDICVVKSDGTLQTNLTNHPKGDGVPRWSPDGSQLAFVSERDGGNEIYTLGADGVRRLTYSAETDTAPTWSPDGERIAFVSRRDGNYEVYVMKSDGTAQTNLTRHASDDSGPAWSPDGKRIAFDSYRDGQQRIYVMNSDGTGVTRLSNGRYDHKPAWSPDGKQIAFTSMRDGNYEIYVMNADGSNPRRLTNNTQPDTGAIWSPDGARIAYCSYTPGIRYRIYVMNADGSGKTLLGQGIEGCPYSWR